MHQKMSVVGQGLIQMHQIVQPMKGQFVESLQSHHLIAAAGGGATAAAGGGAVWNASNELSAWAEVLVGATSSKPNRSTSGAAGAGADAASAAFFSFLLDFFTFDDDDLDDFRVGTSLLVLPEEPLSIPPSPYLPAYPGFDAPIPLSP